MKYLPTRENFENFPSSLIPYTANFDPALAGLIREVSNTHAPDLTVIQRWEDALGFARALQVCPFYSLFWSPSAT